MSAHMIHDLHLTCPCGAVLDFKSTMGETLRKERSAFDLAHATCRAVEILRQERRASEPYGWMKSAN